MHTEDFELSQKYDAWWLFQAKARLVKRGLINFHFYSMWYVAILASTVDQLTIIKLPKANKSVV